MSTEQDDNDRNVGIEMIVITYDTQSRDEERSHDVSHDASHDPRTTEAEQRIKSDHVTMPAPPTEESLMVPEQ